MFAGLKNKIKEETGNDVSRISSIVSATPAKAKGKHSRHGSTTSLGSFTIDGSKDDMPGVLDIKLADGRPITPKEFKKLESKEDEWRRKLQKRDEEYAAQLRKVEESWTKKMDDKEKEYSKSLEIKNNETRQLLLELKNLQLDKKTLQQEVKQKDEYKNKIYQYQEDLDQLEGFQTQEIAKVKHLLLEKEQILVEKEKEIQQYKEQIEEMSADVRRFQHSERELHDVEDRLEALRHKSEQDKSMLTSRLAAEEENSRHLKDRLAVLDARCRAGCAGLGAELTVDERVQGLLGERTLLERLLAEAHEHLAEVKTTWSGTISSLETQVGRLCRQASEESGERRIAERARDEIARRICDLEEQLRKSKLEGAANEEKLVCVSEERDKLLLEVTGLNSQLIKRSANCQETVVTPLINRRDNEASATSNLNKLEMDNEVLTKALSDQKVNNSQLLTQFAEMKDLCEAEKKFCEKLQTDIGRERHEKDVMMMRNAEVSQEIELVKQELRNFRIDSAETQLQIKQLQSDVRKKNEELISERAEKDELLERIRNVENSKKESETSIAEKEKMNEIVENLESQLQERNKTVKSLQMRINDMKKTLQRELNVPSRTIDPGGQNGAGIIPAYGPALLTPACPEDVEDAQHLTRAVATLLRFTAEEEKLLKETMDWKMSWFGSRPKVGNGPMSRTMPPS